MLHNYCEAHGESICEENVRIVTMQEKDVQPQSVCCGLSNESEGKRIRQVLTKYFDP